MTQHLEDTVVGIVVRTGDDDKVTIAERRARSHCRDSRVGHRGDTRGETGRCNCGLSRTRLRVDVVDLTTPQRSIVVVVLVEADEVVLNIESLTVDSCGGTCHRQITIDGCVPTEKNVRCTDREVISSTGVILHGEKVTGHCRTGVIPDEDTSLSVTKNDSRRRTVVVRRLKISRTGGRGDGYIASAGSQADSGSGCQTFHRQRRPGAVDNQILGTAESGKSSDHTAGGEDKVIAIVVSVDQITRGIIPHPQGPLAGGRRLWVRGLLSKHHSNRVDNAGDVDITVDGECFASCIGKP